MSATVLHFPGQSVSRSNATVLVDGNGPRGLVVRPAPAFWNKDARTLGHASAAERPAYVADLLEAMSAGERLLQASGAVTMIGRDYHGGLAMQIARLKAALAPHGIDAPPALASDAPQIAPTLLLLVAAMAGSARAVASIAQSRAAKRPASEPAPTDIAILATGLAALIASAAFTTARRSAERDQTMSELAATSGDMLKAVTMNRPHAPPFARLLGAIEDLLVRLDDASGPDRPLLAS
jgi:hypothetical protein